MFVKMIVRKVKNLLSMFIAPWVITRTNRIYINAAGLVALILGRKKPIAKSFKGYVIGDVCACIRKAGICMTKEKVKD